MPTWRLMLLSLLLCTTGVGCTDPDPTPDAGTTVDSGTHTADSGSDSGTNPVDSGTDAGTNPADSGTDAGTGPEDSGTDAGTGPVDSGTDAGTGPVDSGTDGGTDPTDGGVDGGSSGNDAGTDAGPTDSAVRIRRFRRYLTASGYEARPEDFTQNPVRLFVLDGGTLVSVPGMAGAPGEYVFPDVPRAPYYVETADAFVVTDARDLDLSINLLGRADARLAETDPEVGDLARVDVDGLEPWQGTRSELQVVSGELDFVGRPFTSDIDAGAVSIQEVAPMGNDTGPTPRFEQARGDRAWVLQMAERELGTQSDGGVMRYTTTVRAVHLPPFSYDGTVPMPLQGTLQELRMNEFALDWRVPDFSALASEVHPEATYRSSSFFLQPAAHGPPEGWVGWSGELVSMSRPRGDASTVQGTLAYGNPYPSNWGLVATATATFVMSARLPEDETLYSLTVGSTSMTDHASSLTAGPIVPRVRPPRALTLDGTPAYGPRTLSSAEHVVSWEPPASGVPEAYGLSLRELESFGGPQLFAISSAFIYVDGRSTSAVLPARLLEPGKHYILLVSAIHAPGYDVSVRPLMLIDRVTQARASTATGVLSVPPQEP